MSAGFVTRETLVRDEEREGIVCYGVGICHVSVCCPDAMPVDLLLDAVNRLWPTGLSHGWMIDTAETFASGHPNPCPCEQTEGRFHRLLEC